MKINIITLGCSKNTVDSENLAGKLKAAGHTVCFDSQSDHHAHPFDAVIINTCGFIGDAKEESINTILQCVNTRISKHANPANTFKIIACGCLVERYKDELQKEIPEVDAWYGVHEWDKIIEAIGTIKPIPSKNTPRSLSTPTHYAYLKIAEGCNRSCSYCAIPLIRGAHRSRPIDDIVNEAKFLVAGGVKELLIISQDTTYYGLDLYHRRALGELLERLATEVTMPGQSSTRPERPWIRLHYTYPSSFPLDAIDAIRNHPNICNYIDIPLQHINSRILDSMQRGIDREGTLALIDRFRQQLPDVAIRTTLIVGYPGETLEQFEELKDFVRNARFDRLGCFAYSPEEGTPAYKLHDDVPDDEKQRRLDEIMEIQRDISLEKNLSRVGNTYQVLIDRKEGDYLVGRTQYDSPEVDNEVLIKTGRNCQPGDFIPVRITSATEYDLFGEPARQ